MKVKKYELVRIIDKLKNIGYFEGKIDCMNRKIYVYDEGQAREDILNLMDEYDVKDEFMNDRFDFETIDDVVNAKGHGAPKGTQNALKHGGYSAVYWDTLDEDERELIESMPQDEEEILINQIALYTVRERRLMKAINKYRDSKGGVYVAGAIRFEKKRTFKDDEEKELYEERIQEKVMKNERLPGESYDLQTSTASTADLVARLEKELTSVQSCKTKAVDALAKLRLEKEKAAGESKGNELVRAWADSVIKSRREQNGQ